MKNTLEQLVAPKISAATDAEIVAYLRRTGKIAEIAAMAERETLILNTCQQLNMTVSEEELQASGDIFRRDRKLLTAPATLTWLQQQRMTVDDWSQGVRVALLERKLKEHLFGAIVDSHYLSHRNDYRRVALSQILVLDLAAAQDIVRVLHEEKTSFCALALEHSKGKQSQENGGFAGVQFVAKLMPEIAEAIAQAQAGEILAPIQTKLGYHVLRVEKWFPTQFSEPVREQILETLFQNWLKAQDRSLTASVPSDRVDTGTAADFT